MRLFGAVSAAEDAPAFASPWSRCVRGKDPSPKRIELRAERIRQPRGLFGRMQRVPKVCDDPRCCRSAVKEHGSPEEFQFPMLDLVEMIRNVPAVLGAVTEAPTQSKEPIEIVAPQVCFG